MIWNIKLGKKSFNWTYMFNYFHHFLLWKVGFAFAFSYWDRRDNSEYLDDPKELSVVTLSIKFYHPFIRTLPNIFWRDFFSMQSKVNKQYGWLPLNNIVRSGWNFSHWNKRNLTVIRLWFFVFFLREIFLKSYSKIWYFLEFAFKQKISNKQIPKNIK